MATETTRLQIYHSPVGFNPFRSQRKTVTDIVIVVAFIIITAVTVAWGFLG